MKIRVRADDDQLAKLLHGVVGTCEATSYEKHMLWQEYAQEALKLREGGPDRRIRYPWKEGLSGLGHGVGEIDDRPIVLSLLVDTVAGHRILFWYPTSPIVDYVQIEDWLDQTLPNAKSGDPMNFCNLLSGLPDKVCLYCHTENIETV